VRAWVSLSDEDLSQGLVSKSTTEQQKAYSISLEEVELAWHRVRAKGGVGGVAGEGIKSFERNLSRNLYKL